MRGLRVQPDGAIGFAVANKTEPRLGFQWRVLRVSTSAEKL
jgi:hypothetical protein